MTMRPDRAGRLVHRPGRLLAAAAVVLASTGAVWLAHSAKDADQQPPGAMTARPDPTAPHPGADAPRRAAVTPDTHRDAGHRRSREVVRRTAARYLRVFLSPAGSEMAWHARLERVSTGTLARLNATVPRAAVPDATLRRLTLIALSSSYASVEAVLSDGTRLTVALVLGTAGWKVTEVAPEPAR
jgi:hypothetical protein